MAVEQNAQKSFLDALYCEEQEEKWCDIEHDDDERSEITSTQNNLQNNNIFLFPLLLLEQDLFWDDEELKSLFAKERETRRPKLDDTASASLSRTRMEAVQWVLKINARYGFSPLTAVLAVDYLDRFLFGFVGFHEEKKPWMMQLVAVTCLSLAAKVEETHVPLLLDLQVEDAKYVFEAKTIQRMELLVLSGLKWRMNPVTPLSFLDHIIRRLGLKSYIHWEFLRSCENLLLSVIPDPRFMHYFPSVLATATMLHVIHQVEPCNAAVYENQLLGVLKISKEEVDDCYELISDVVISNAGNENPPSKRKFSSGDGSNDSWPLSSSSCILSSSSTRDHHQPVLKKTRRVKEQQMRLPSLSRVFVDPVGSPH